MLAAFIVPSPAGAVDIGALAPTPAPPPSCTGPFPGLPIPASVYISGDAAAVVPAGGAVITQLRSANAGLAGTQFTYRVIRTEGAVVKPVATVPATLGADGGATVPVSVPVRAGDRIGIEVVSGAMGCYFANAGSTLTTATSVVDGTAFTFVSPFPFANRLNALARVEPDADKDGFGDETQDACASDAATHTDACAVDLKLTQTLTDASVPVGGLQVATLALSGGAARGAKVEMKLPEGVEFVSGAGPAGACAGAGTVSCSFGDMAKDATASAFLVLRATSPGRKTLTSTASSTTAELDAASNAAASSFDVTAPAVVAASVQRCAPPKLTGLTLAAAKKALTAAQCSIGKVRKAKGVKASKLRVKSQSIRKGLEAPVGTKVDLSLGGPKARKKAKGKA